MTFEETTDFLYKQTPAFQQKGASAYKPGLDNTQLLDEYFAHPHKSYMTIHVGGTNGKGSTSHTLASILQQAGYRVGLYTSPHLVDFRERIRVDGEMIPKQYVVDFVAQHFDNVSHIKPSFFELTMMMAFDYFRSEKVDIAIIEVGLGGRLDSTNIISPILSIITNISFDHVQFLGNSIEAIAAEKAGIIKQNTPIIIGEYTSVSKPVFIQKAEQEHAPIYFAQEVFNDLSSTLSKDHKWIYDCEQYPNLIGELGGACQPLNTATVLTALEILKTKLNISQEAIYKGFNAVIQNTGLQGRWQVLNQSPTIITDTAHNEAGIKFVTDQIKSLSNITKRLILGFANDKDVAHIIPLLPKDAIYYFTVASVDRAMPISTLQSMIEGSNLNCSYHNSVKLAFETANKESTDDDLIFIGGSNFIVADFLSIDFKQYL